MPDLAPGGSLPVVGTKTIPGLQDGSRESSAQLPWDWHGAAVLEGKHRRGPSHLCSTSQRGTCETAGVNRVGMERKWRESLQGKIIIYLWLLQGNCNYYMDN